MVRSTTAVTPRHHRKIPQSREKRTRIDLGIGDHARVRSHTGDTLGEPRAGDSRDSFGRCACRSRHLSSTSHQERSQRRGGPASECCPRPTNLFSPREHRQDQTDQAQGNRTRIDFRIVYLSQGKMCFKSSRGFKDRRVSTVETSISREEWPATLVKSGVDGHTAKLPHLQSSPQSNAELVLYSRNRNRQRPRILPQQS